MYNLHLTPRLGVQHSKDSPTLQAMADPHRMARAQENPTKDPTLNPRVDIQGASRQWAKRRDARTPNRRSGFTSQCIPTMVNKMVRATA